MKNCEVSEGDDKYMSWDEFKEEYLPKVKYVAALLGLSREKVITVGAGPSSQPCQRNNSH
jgi:hypothetical protein